MYGCFPLTLPFWCSEKVRYRITADMLFVLRSVGRENLCIERVFSVPKALAHLDNGAFPFRGDTMLLPTASSKDVFAIFGSKYSRVCLRALLPGDGFTMHSFQLCKLFMLSVVPDLVSVSGGYIPLLHGKTHC